MLCLLNKITERILMKIYNIGFGRELIDEDYNDSMLSEALVRFTLSESVESVNKSAHFLRMVRENAP